MKLHTDLPEIKALDRDEQGPFLRLQLYCMDGQACIRWGIDHFTYKSLTKHLEQTGLTLAKGIRLAFDEFWNSAEQHFLGHLVRKGAEDYTDSFFACTRLFIANLRWLKNISSIEQIRNLSCDEGPILLQGKEPLKLRAKSFPAAKHLLLALVPVAVLFTYLAWNGVHSGGKDSINRLTVRSISSLGSSDISEALGANLKHLPASQATIGPFATKVHSTDLNHAEPGAPSKELQAYLAGNVVWRLPPGYVALTFDDGPSVYTDQILAILNRYHVRATFFFVGSRVPLWPSSVRRVAAAGDGIGNHTMTHPQLIYLSEAGQKSQIIDTNLVIEHVAGVTPTLLRPPYEEFNSITSRLLQQSHMQLALWNRDPRDWQATSAEQIVQGVLQNHPSGGIFDMHEKSLTVAALPAIIQGLQEKHLKFLVLGKPLQQ